MKNVRKGEYQEASGIVREKSGNCLGSWKIFQDGEKAINSNEFVFQNDKCEWKLLMLERPKLNK